MKNYLRLNLSLLYWVFVAPFTGQFFKISPIFRQMVFIGVRATSMVALTAFSIGVTLAMRPDPATVRMVLNSQMAKAGPPTDGKDFGYGDLDWGILLPASPLTISDEVRGIEPACGRTIWSSARTQRP